MMAARMRLPHWSSDFSREDGTHACCVIEPIAATAAAMRTGFESARYDLVAFTDADCQFDLADLGKLAPFAAEYPIVAGFRADRKDPWRRRLLSWGYNRLARTMLGTSVRDVDCALKVFIGAGPGGTLARVAGLLCEHRDDDAGPATRL